MEVILNDFQKTCNSFYFQNTLLTLLHLALIKTFPNMSHVDTKIQRLLIPSLLSEQFQSFMKYPPFSPLGEMIYKIKIISWCVSLSFRAQLWLHPILCHLATATHPLYSKLKLIAVCLSGKSL